MTDAMRRVSVHVGDESRTHTIDLMVPATVAVAELMPSILDLVGVQSGEAPGRWQVSRLAGAAVEQSMTLSQMDVRDGDVLVLSRAPAPAPRLRPYDVATEVADATPTGPPSRAVSSGAAAWTVLVGAGALWLAHAAAAHLVAVASLAAAAGAAAVIAERRRRDPWWHMTLRHLALLLVAAVGFRVVPGGPGAANVLLAVSAVTAASVVFGRLSVRESVWNEAVTVLGVITTVAATAATVWPLPAPVVGAALTVSGFAVLGLAPRLSVLVAGLGPIAAPTAAHDDAAARAARGRRLLTALVTGASAAVALGMVLVVVRGHHSGAPWQVDAGCCAAAGAALLLRSRSYADGWCRVALVVTGMLCLTAGLGLVLLALPAQATWVGMVTVAAGCAAMTPGAWSAAGPAAARAVDTLEYVALTAVIPLACWIAGVFAAVRGWQVS